MKKPSLWYPAKPFIVSQGWGIKNPSYNQFGFSEHNGVDFLTGYKNEVHAPLPCLVLETGFNESAGNFVRLASTEKYQIGDKEGYFGIMFMHAEKILCTKGQVLKTGELVMIADSTGFSTGPHTHMSCRTLSKQSWDKKYRLDTYAPADYTFDPRPYWNNYFAQDYGVVSNIMNQLSMLLAQLKVRK